MHRRCSTVRRSAILRRNPDSVVIPFDTSAYDAKIDPKRFDPKYRRANWQSTVVVEQTVRCHW